MIDLGRPSHVRDRNHIRQRTAVHVAGVLLGRVDCLPSHSFLPQFRRLDDFLNVCFSCATCRSIEESPPSLFDPNTASISYQRIPMSAFARSRVDRNDEDWSSLTWFGQVSRTKCACILSFGRSEESLACCPSILILTLHHGKELGTDNVHVGILLRQQSEYFFHDVVIQLVRAVYRHQIRCCDACCRCRLSCNRLRLRWGGLIACFIALSIRLRDFCALLLTLVCQRLERLLLLLIEFCSSSRRGSFLSFATLVDLCLLENLCSVPVSVPFVGE